jgi:hypothetical protein
VIDEDVPKLNNFTHALFSFMKTPAAAFLSASFQALRYLPAWNLPTMFSYCSGLITIKPECLVPNPWKT